MEIEFYPNDFLIFISAALSTFASSFTTVFYAKNFNRFDEVEFPGDRSVLLKITPGLHYAFCKAYVPLTALLLPPTEKS
jgi:hypothetical protein